VGAGNNGVAVACLACVGRVAWGDFLDWTAPDGRWREESIGRIRVVAFWTGRADDCWATSFGCCYLATVVQMHGMPRAVHSARTHTHTHTHTHTPMRCLVCVETEATRQHELRRGSVGDGGVS
jgi:hypothetical protein